MINARYRREHTKCFIELFGEISLPSRTHTQCPNLDDVFITASKNKIETSKSNRIISAISFATWQNDLWSQSQSSTKFKWWFSDPNKPHNAFSHLSCRVSLSSIPIWSNKIDCHQWTHQRLNNNNKNDKNYRSPPNGNGRVFGCAWITRWQRKQHSRAHTYTHIFFLFVKPSTEDRNFFFKFMLCKTALKNYINKIGKNIYEETVVWLLNSREQNSYRRQNEIEKLTENWNQSGLKLIVDTSKQRDGK